MKEPEMTNSKIQKDKINIAVRKAYNLIEKSRIKQAGVFSLHDEIMRNALKSDDFYYKYPRNIIFKVSSECNLRCKHCFFYDKKECYDSTNELCDEEKLKLVRYFAEDINIMHCTLTGGEIFASPIIFDIIKILKKNNIPLDLLTNGTLIDEKIADKLSEILNPSYDLFQISLEGANENINDKIRGKGSFNKIIKAIKLLKNYKFKVFVATTLNNSNVEQLTDIYKLCKELKVDRLNIGKMVPVHESHKKMTATTEQIIVNTAKLYDIYDDSLKLKFRGLNTSDFLEFEEGRKIFDEKLEKESTDNPILHCTPHHDQVAIFPNGNVSICYDCDKPIFSIGNLKKDTFNKIWQNRFSHPLFKKRLAVNSACRNCKYIPFCNTGCIFRAIELHNTINAPGIDCKYYNDVVSKKNMVKK